MAVPRLCKDRQRYVGASGERPSCTSEHGVACRWSAEGGKPDRASAVIGRPAGAPAAREAE